MNKKNIKPIDTLCADEFSLLPEIISDTKVGYDVIIFLRDFSSKSTPKYKIYTTNDDKLYDDINKKLVPIVQAFNPKSRTWIKINRTTGKVTHRKTKGKWKNIPEYNSPTFKGFPIITNKKQIIDIIEG